MLQTIKLNTIKNKLNDFELRACVYIARSNRNNEEFNPFYYSINTKPFYILATNKIAGSYVVKSYNPFTGLFSLGIDKNILLDACKVQDNNLLEIYNLSLDKFLLMQKNNNKDFLGWLPNSDLIDKNIEEVRGIKNSKHHKDTIYYGDNTYTVDEYKLYLFIRIVPKDCNTLTNLLINCTRDNIYNICERSNINKLGSLGFIVKLNNRYKFTYSRLSKKFTRIKYPFLSKDIINNELFDGFEGDYDLSKEIIYIKDNSKLDEYGIKILDNF